GLRAATRRARARGGDRRPGRGARASLQVRGRPVGADRRRRRSSRGARPRTGRLGPAARAGRAADLHGNARAAQADRRARARPAVLGACGVRIRVGHLYPDYLNIYADRGNIAVLARRAAWRGHELEVESVSMGDALRPDAHDLLYVGGGQDREQALVAVDLAAKADAVHEAAARGAAVLAVCGGYQLLGRSYRDRDGVELPGIGLLPLVTVAGERRMIGDVLLDCEWAGRSVAGVEDHAGRALLDEGALPLRRRVHG